jgi:two-component system phosphate regulon sensor histidine kinase PhoR
MNDGIFIIDGNEMVTLINPSASKIFAIKPEEAIGHTLAEAFRNFRLNELYALCIRTGRQESMSFDLAPNKAYIQCIVTPLAPELPGNYLFLIQDLTRLRQLEIVRRDFVSNVSHELRTPLASLKLITETLQEGALNDPPAAKKFLERMEGEIDNLTQLVGELLELSRIESGKVPLDKKWIDPSELVRSAEERMQLQSDRAGIILKTHLEESLPNIYIDPPRLEQVLVNLLHNSIKFTNPGGEIEIRVEKLHDEIIFHIRDTGVGIPAKDLERIFERFYKTDRSRTERGTGLGLSISRHLVEAHQGKIWAKSTPGEGSTFSFSIPIH